MPQINTHSFHLSQLPSTDLHCFSPGSVETAQLGNIATIRAGWGFPVDNAMLVAHYVAEGWDAEQARRAIESTGFSSGYYFPPSNDIFSEETQDLHVHYVVQMVEALCHLRDWDGLDLLVIGSCSSREDIAQRAQQSLQKHGLGVGAARLYNMACNAAMSAIDDLVRDPQYWGLRCVVVGLETFSGEKIDYSNPTTIRTFANGGGALAFIPGQEISFITGRSVVEFDERGVVAGPQLCALPPHAKRHAPPPWYECIGAEAPQRIYSDSGGNLYMHLPYTADNILRSNGMATLSYFARRIPPLTVDVMQCYHERFAPQHGPLAAHAFSHQPSGPVIHFLNQEMLRLALESKALAKKEARRISRMDNPTERGLEMLRQNVTPLHLPSIDWFMPEIGFNNTSAGTPMVVLTEMIRRGLLGYKEPTAVYGMGVGSVIMASVWRFWG